VSAHIGMNGPMAGSGTAACGAAKARISRIDNAIAPAHTACWRVARWIRKLSISHPRERLHLPGL
jgi:hypothetical protein